MTNFVDDELSSNRKTGEHIMDLPGSISGLEQDIAPSNSKIVTARGTEEGLVLRIDGRANWDNILSEVRSFLGERKRFLEGGEIGIEWLDRLPTKEQSSHLESLLREQCGVEIAGRKKKSPKLTLTSGKSSRQADEHAEVNLALEKKVKSDNFFDEAKGVENPISMLEPFGIYPRGSVHNQDSSLSAEIQVSSQSQGRGVMDAESLKRVTDLLGEEELFEEDANARIVYGMLRSGQRIETPYTLVIIGDVNPGADIVAGGDIIVFGSLRGTAHASAYDDDCLNRVIIALSMQPMQLRIGSVISRGNGERGRGAEIARIEDRRIVVEAFNSRVFSLRS